MPCGVLPALQRNPLYIGIIRAKRLADRCRQEVIRCDREAFPLAKHASTRAFPRLNSRRIEVLNSTIMLDLWQFHNGKGKIAAGRE